MSPTPRISPRLTDLAEILGNVDCIALEDADTALASDTAAFWSATDGTSALSAWRGYVNRAGSIDRGLAQVRADFPHSPVEAKALAFLDRLIPLNDEAVADLEGAYRRLGTFRSADELEAREAHAYRDAEKALFPLPASEIAELRERFAARQAEVETARRLVRALNERGTANLAKLEPEEASARIATLRDEIELHPERAVALEPEITALDALFSDRATADAMGRL